MAFTSNCSSILYSFIILFYYFLAIFHNLLPSTLIILLVVLDNYWKLIRSWGAATVHLAGQWIDGCEAATTQQFIKLANSKLTPPEPPFALANYELHLTSTAQRQRSGVCQVPRRDWTLRTLDSSSTHLIWRLDAFYGFNWQFTQQHSSRSALHPTRTASHANCCKPQKHASAEKEFNLLDERVYRTVKPQQSAAKKLTEKKYKELNYGKTSK